MTQSDRITSLESEVGFLRQELQEVKQDLKESNLKLDMLLDLRNKGAGVFWLASVIFGMSMIGAVTALISLFKG